MFIRTIRATGVGAFFLGLGILTTGCNTDGLWADQRAPKEQRASAREAESVRRPGQSFDITVAAGEEVDLVEAVVMHRARYHHALGRLRDYYEAHGDATKLAWAENSSASVAPT